MVMEMTHCGLDFVDILPVEVVEEILQYLSMTDLINCSLVSVKWREIVNNNSIWAKLCMREKIYNREQLQCSHSHFRNPIKAFRPVENTSDRLSNICFWRSHYDRYKYLANNWRTGRCSLHRLDVSDDTYTTFYKDSILVIVYNDNFEAYSLAGNIKKVAKMKFHHRPLSLDTLLVCKDMLIYSQKYHIVGLKLDGSKQVAFNVDVARYGNRTEERITNGNQLPTKERLYIKRAENYMIVVDNCRRDEFLIWDINGVFERAVQLEDGKYSHLCHINCCAVSNFKIYLAYSYESYHFVREYNLIKNKWGVKMCVPRRVKKLLVTQEILGASLYKDMDMFDFYVWSLKDMSEITNFSIDKNEPIVLTNKAVFHYYNDTVKFLTFEYPGNSRELKIPTDIIVNMFAVSDNLLVINTGNAIQVWDWVKEEKLYTPYRGICSRSMWVDEKMIIMSRWSCHFQIIGYW